jgi:Spherulation-specific family 4
MTSRPRIIASLATLALASAAVVGASSVATAQAKPAVQIAVPAYFNDDASWDRAINTPEVGYIVGHPDSPAAGKPFVVEADLVKRLAQAKAKGIKTLIYVTAGYDKVSWQDTLTRVDSAFGAYPTADGVFLDEINYDQCDKYTNFSKGITGTAGFRGRHPGKIALFNPGAPMLNCYEGLADGYLNLERAQADVPAWNENVFLKDNAPYYAWMFKQENRSAIWQMIHSVAPSQIGAAVDAALTRNASVVYVTPDLMPNPYDNFPDDGAWKALVDRVAAYNSGKVALPVVVGPKVAPAATVKPAAAVTPTTKKPATAKKPTVKKAATKKTVVKKK